MYATTIPMETIMTSPYDTFDTNEDLETGSGVTLDYLGFSITIHRAGGKNKKFERIILEKFKPYRRKHEQGILEDEIANRIMAEAFAEAVIIGWKDVKGKDGKNISFTVKNCVKLMLDLPELFKDIQLQAQDFSTFRKEVEEIEEKN